MLLRKLGQTGITVSEIGFGGWGLGMDMWLGVDEATCRDAVAAALGAGVSFYDTALAYGWGVGEQILADAIEGSATGEPPIVATKIPPLNDEWPARHGVPLAATFPAEHVRQCVQRSRRNLGTETLDLAQLHVWHDDWLKDPGWPETRAEMIALKESGAVAHWGVSVNDHAPHTALEVIQDELVETVQLIYNIFDRSAERELFEIARDRSLGLIVRVPFDEGALTGAFTKATRFPDGDWRNEYFTGERLTQVVERARQIEEVGRAESDSLAELALRFCLSRPEVSTVIPGMRRRRHGEANAAVSDGRRLSYELLQQLRQFEWPRNWY